MSKQPTELSDAEREELRRTLHARLDTAKHLGYSLADCGTAAAKSLVANIADISAGDVSVCGAKTILIEELRQFKTAEGETKEIRCATAAVLEMTDSPVHVHATTLEYYIVLSGRGKFILGAGDDEHVVDVQQGSVILLPPGQPHGIVADNPDVPVRALLTFTPGLAPKDQPEFRDEEIIHARASERLGEREN